MADPTRRGVLGAFALTVPAGPLAASLAPANDAPPHPDAALFALELEVAEADAELERVSAEHEAAGRELDGLRDPRTPAAVARVHGALDRMGRTPARTPRGALVKARALRHAAENGSTGHEEGIARSLCDDLSGCTCSPGGSEPGR